MEREGESGTGGGERRRGWDGRWGEKRVGQEVEREGEGGMGSEERREKSQERRRDVHVHVMNREERGEERGSHC